MEQVLINVLVVLSQSIICFGGNCYNALVGYSTPTGSYLTIKSSIEDPLYDYKFAVFAKDSNGKSYGVHPVWQGDPKRNKVIKYGSDSKRVMTNGCINIEPGVYDSLPDVFNLEIIE